MTATMKPMTAGELIEALQAFPKSARVIVEYDPGDDEQRVETYAEAGAPEVRYLHAQDKEITWDMTPTIETAESAEIVVLIAPRSSERPKYRAPEATAGGLVYREVDPQ